MHCIKILCCRTACASILHPIQPPCAPALIISQRSLSQYVNKIRHLQKLKEDGDFCKKAFDDAQFAVFYGLRPLVREVQSEYGIAWMNKSEIEDKLNIDIASQNLALLNCDEPDDSSTNLRALFAISIPDETSSDDRKHQKMIEGALSATSMSMRKVMFLASQSQVNLISQGHAYLQWHSNHQYCSNCSAKMQSNTAGNKRECTQCSETSFPVMSPVAITLVTNDEQCLVARQSQFPKGMFSALAGFCEPGETLEDAARREVAEEVGLDVGNITYDTSQHWPFPSSALMLACYASIKQGTSTQVSLDVNEIEETKWLHRQEVKHLLGIKDGRSPEGPPIWLPPSQAVAHQLLKNWASL